jgi:hypothetical protein
MQASQNFLVSTKLRHRVYLNQLPITAVLTLRLFRLDKPWKPNHTSIRCLLIISPRNIYRGLILGLTTTFCLRYFCGCTEAVGCYTLSSKKGQKLNWRSFYGNKPIYAIKIVFMMFMSIFLLHTMLQFYNILKSSPTTTSFPGFA